jgi:hypothetical protein
MKNNIRKGQAAIEFLVTYGWAIMAAMVVIGALTYFGMTNPSTSLPDKCIFSNAFGCKDYRITTSADGASSTLDLQMINTYGQTIYGPIIATCTDDDTIICTPNPIIAPGGYLDPDGVINMSCTNPPDSPFDVKEKAKVKITISYYKNPTGGFKQVSLGEIYTTVQNE